MAIPGLKKPDHIGFTVPNLAEAIAFFCDHFDFELAYEFGPFVASDNWMAEHLNVNARAEITRIAVMNAGSLVEIGDAEALYHRPRTRFVAEFIGRANLVEALVVGGSGEQIEVEALGQRLTVAPGAGRAAPGSRGLLLLRPEALALAPAGAHDGAVEATVKSRSFLGEKVEYLLDCGGRTLQVVRPSLGGAPRFAPGQRVGLQVLPGAGTLVDAR